MNNKQFQTKSDFVALNLINVPCWVFRIDSHQIWWGNHAAVRFWGATSQEELCQKDFSSDSLSVRQRLRQLYDTTEAYSFIRESWTLYPEGQPQMMEISLSPMPIGPEQVPAILVQIEGQSSFIGDADNKRQLNAMRYTPLMVSTIDVAGTLLSQNPGSILTFGRRAQDVFHERFVDPKNLENIISQCQETGEFSGMVEVFTLEGLRTHHIEARLGRDPILGGPCITLTQHDISEQVKAQNDLVVLNLELEQRVMNRTKDLTDANGRLAQLSENKSRILANMTHELRTPLNAVIGFAELLAEQIENKQRREYAHFVKDSARHLLAIINDILELSRIDAGEAELTIESVDLHLVVEDCCNMLMVKARNRQVHLDMSQLPSHLHVKGDYRALMRIMVNLVGNAIKYTLADGHVKISATCDPQHVIVDIIDTGIGIPETALEKVLLPFGQSRNFKIEHNAQEGTGLGLPIAKQLTEAQGGEFQLTSQENIGTHIQLKLQRSPCCCPEE